MSNIIPYNPFEDLNEFPDLKRLTHYILHSLEVKEVKVRLPLGFDHSLIRDPIAILPVSEILVGNATFNYIRGKADYILKNISERIQKININTSMGFEDKFQLYQKVRKEILYHYDYFNSMNPIRYMSSFKWKIIYTVEQDEKLVDKEEIYPNSKLDLKEGDWNILENTLLIRRHLLYEILCLIDIELKELEEELTNTKYTWQGKGPYEIYELLIALIASDRIRYFKGDESTFIHDFLSLFGKSDEEFAYSRGKVLDRVNRSRFLLELEEGLEKRRGTSK